MDKLMLSFVLFFVKTFLKKDVDFERLKIITQTKLITDRRRVRVTMKGRKENKEPKNQMLITQIVYGFFGLFIGFMIMSTDEILLAMVLLHSYILFMMAMTLITDFSTVMLDTTDNQIILPRPVTAKTLFVSRLVHILVYLLQFGIVLSLFPLIFTFVTFGPVVGIATIFTITLTIAFAVFLTYLLYGLILRVSSEEKIKDIISYFQIGMTIFFAVGYQIIPRLVNIENLKITLPLHWYAYIAPPVWMAVALQALQTVNFDKVHLIMLAFSVLIPLITFWVMIKFLAPSFSKKLAALGNSTESSSKAVKTGSQQKTSGIEKISVVLSSNKTEQAGFDLTWKMTGRDKGFKMQFYPSLAYLFVFAFIFVFKSGKDIGDLWSKLPATKMFLWFTYLPLFTISSAVALVAYNENFAASWIYSASPLRKPGSLISGALKSILVKFFIPVFLVLFGFSFYVWGVSIIDDFVLGFFNNILVFLLLAHIGTSYLPFSMQPGVKQQSGKLARMLLQFALVAAIVGLHYLATMMVWIVPVLIPFSVLGCYLFFRLIQNYSWQKITS